MVDASTILSVLLLAVAVAVAAAAYVRRRERDLLAQRDEVVAAAVQQAVALAGEQLRAQSDLGRAGLQQEGQVLATRLDQVRADLDRVGGLVQQLERSRASSTGALEEQLRTATETTRALAETTGALRTALASPKTRGAWGERMAEDVLRAAGMVEGVNYVVQSTLGGGTRPDLTFRLPAGRVLHMDVKFPLDNYLRALEAADADDPEAEARHRKAFCKDVRNRVAELQGRDYVDPDAGTLDYVLLFLPNEHVYAYVHQHDRELLDHAMARKVILCSPLTLLAVLAVVREAVDNFALERASQDILGLLAGVRGEWEKVTELHVRLARRIDGAQRDLADLEGVRTRGMERQLDRIDEVRTERGLGADAPPGPALRAVAGE